VANAKRTAAIGTDTITQQGPDAAELLRLALAASAGNDSEASIGFLKRAIALDERAAEPHYLLGAEYAGKGLYEQAVAEMQAALARKPELAAARFQLGLLFLTMARIEEAATTWGLLDMLPAEHPFLLFKTGLLHLVRDEFDQAASFLQAGMARNHENQALNRDMQLVLDQIARVRAGTAGSEPAEASAQHFLVSTYRKH
jgi:tetratricopeptide (TPR) repeat protein